jgi:molybdenum cofactor cytidylyltransferase
MTLPLNIVILAAGAGSRMGHVPKCLIHANGRTLLERLLQATAPLRAERTVVALGQHALTITQAMTGLPIACGVRIAHNTAPDDDPAGSLLVALRQLGAHAQHPVMVLLADQPTLGATELKQVWQAYQQRAEGIEVVWPTVEGAPGHPVVMSERVAHALVAGQFQSLKQWRALHPETVAPWVTCNTHHTCHLDTLADLQTLCMETGLDWQLPPEAAKRIRVNPSPTKPAQA